MGAGSAPSRRGWTLCSGFWTRVRVAVPRWGRAALGQDASHPHIANAPRLGHFLPSRTTPQNIEGADNDDHLTAQPPPRELRPGPSPPARPWGSLREKRDDRHLARPHSLPPDRLHARPF